MRDKGKLPDFIIIGALKCGTTSLHYYLSQHPDIFMSRVKELRFFYDQGNWGRGVNWYKSNFSARQAVCGEASPQYTDYPRAQNVPARMANLVPDVKLLFLVRDPVQRIISHYIMLNNLGKEKRSLTEAVHNFEQSRLVHISRYAFQLNLYLPYYSARQILVIRSSELKDARASTLSRIFSFLGVRASFHSHRFHTVKHVTASGRLLRPAGQKIWLLIDRWLGVWHSGLAWHVQRTVTRPFALPRLELPKLDAGLKSELVAYLRQDAQKLTTLTGIDTSDWMQEAPGLLDSASKPGRTQIVS